MVLFEFGNLLNVFQKYTGIELYLLKHLFKHFFQSLKSTELLRRTPTMLKNIEYLHILTYS